MILLEFFTSIGNAIYTVFQLLLNMVQGLVQFFLMIPQFLTYLTTVFAYVPAPLVIFLTMGVTISVILLIVGRN